MDPTLWPPDRHSRLVCRRAACVVACRARDPDPVLAHDCGPARVRTRACCEAPGAHHAAFSRHPHCVPSRPGFSPCLAVFDCEHDVRAVRLALSIRAVVADAGEERSALAPGRDTHIIWYHAESDCVCPRSAHYKYRRLRGEHCAAAYRDCRCHPGCDSGRGDEYLPRLQWLTCSRLVP